MCARRLASCSQRARTPTTENHNMYYQRWSGAKTVFLSCSQPVVRISTRKNGCEQAEPGACFVTSTLSMGLVRYKMRRETTSNFAKRSMFPLPYSKLPPRTVFIFTGKNDNLYHVPAVVVSLNRNTAYLL